MSSATAVPMNSVNTDQTTQTVGSPFKRWVCPAVLLTTLFAVEVRTAYTRPFWFDELSTYFITSTPTLREMFRAIPTDGNPPLYFLLARACLHLPIKMELAMRLPAILAFLGAALAIYRFVLRHTAPRFGLLAMSLFTGSSVAGFAFEARAYSLMLFFTGLALCCWQRACVRSPRGMALAGLAGCIAGAVLSHQYGVICAIVPVFAGETVRTWRRRRLDIPVVGAIFLSVPILLLTVPPTLHAQKLLLDAIRDCPVFFPHPKFSSLGLYAAMVPEVVLALAMPIALFGLLVYALAKEAHLVAPADHLANHPPAEEFAAAAAAALLLPLMLLVTHFGTHYFMTRYGIGSAMGIALLAGMMFAAFNAPRLRVIVTTYAFIISLGMARGFTIEQSQPDPMLLAGNASEPIVFASALQFSPAWWYADSQLRNRMHYLEDLPYALQHSDLLPEYSLELERDYTPMQMENYRTFLAAHSHFLLYCYGESRIEWIKERLVTEGWHLKLLQSAPNPKWPSYKERTYRQIYEASREK